jgi:hypothetical protein
MIDTVINTNPSIIREIAIERLDDTFSISSQREIDIAKKIMNEYENNKAYYESRDVDMAVVAEAENYLDQLSNKN